MYHHVFAVKSVLGFICAGLSIVAASFAMLTDAVSLGIIAVAAATVAAVPPSILAYAALQQAKQNLLKAQLVDAHVAEVGVKTDTVINKATEIHTLTNSNLTRVTEMLNVAHEKIAGLEELVKSMVESKTAADALSTKRAETQSKSPAAIAISGKAGEPTPVIDHQVADLLRGEVTDKLDSIKGDTEDKS